MYDAARAKAHRGELRISVPVGYVWHREVGLGFDPDARLREAIRLIFGAFASWAALARCCCRWQLMACTSRGPQTARRWSASTGRRSATASDQAQTSAPAPDLAGLADDLAAAWNSPHVTMRTRQQLLRTLVKDLEHHLPLHGCRTPEGAGRHAQHQPASGRAHRRVVSTA